MRAAGVPLFKNALGKSAIQSGMSAVMAWDRFWFHADGRTQVHWFRRLFALILFMAVASRSFDLALFYSEAGIMPLSVMSQWMTSPVQWSWTSLLKSELFVGHEMILILLCHIGLLLSLLGLSWGRYPRVFAIIALIFHLSFIRRNVAIVYGLDSIATYFLFYLCLSDDVHSQRSSLLGSIGFRLSQIQLCVIYGYSGLQKLRGTSWWQGDALWGVLANGDLTRWDFTWVAQFPLLLMVGTFCVVCWELYFPVLIWIKPLRVWVLSIGFLIHMGIAIGLNLFFFGLAMLTTYCFFLTNEELGQCMRWIQNRIRYSF